MQRSSTVLTRLQGADESIRYNAAAHVVVPPAQNGLPHTLMILPNQTRANLPAQSASIRVATPRAASAAPAPERAPEAAATPRTPPEAPGAAPERTPPLVAIVVAHGMGQQLPFETLDAVVTGLCAADARVTASDAASCSARVEATVRFAKVGGAELPRAELTLNSGTERETRVHLYEAYWAPLTEGHVTLRDVLRFLWRGANNGVENARGAHGFHRYMFGGIVSFGQQTGALWQLIFTTLVLGALVLLNAVATGVFAAAFLGKSDSLWLDPALTGEVTLVVALALCIGVACVIAMYAAQKMAFFFALLVTLVLAAAVVTVATIAALGWDTAFALPGWLDWMNSLWWTALFWGGLCFASYKIRGVLVQYVGDVAAYVTPHTLDRFYELRQKIKKSMREVADPVYADVQPDGKPTYARVAIVGHSLGSVAAYDVLNAMINSDAVATRPPLGVLERTCILLTFGSPLDKTAFIFNAQGHDTGVLREALGAAVQPLIQDAKYRVFPWVNVYSPADIISGALDLYDPPRSASSAGGVRVTNLADPEARRPIWAHTQYWGTKIVFDQLHAAVAGVPLKSVGSAPTPSTLVM